MSDTNFPLQFHPRDLKLLTVEEVSAQLRVSRAFTRLCIDAGCPSRRGKVSAARLLGWLFQHYNAARQLAGFLPFAEVDGTAPEVARRLNMGNAVITLLEFGQSRASGLREKREIGKVLQTVRTALDRA